MFKHTVKLGSGESGAKVQKKPYSVGQGSAKFFWEELDGEQYRFAGHVVSAATIRLCCCVKAATDSM